MGQVTVKRIEPGISRRRGPQGTSYVAVVELPRGPDGKRRQQRRTFDTLKQARSWRIRTLHELRAGIYVEPSRQTLGEYLEEWLASVEASGDVTPGTAINYRVSLKRARPLFGVRLCDLTTARISAWFTALGKSGDYAPTTLGQTLLTLRMALEDAVRLELLPRNPAEPIRAPRYLPEEPRPLTAEEARRLLAAAAGDWYEPLWRFGLETGVRIGEALALRWEDVDFTDGVVRIERTVSRQTYSRYGESRPKSLAGRRVIPLSPAALDRLRRHHEAEVERRRLDPAWNPEGYVFPSVQGRRLNARLVNDKLAELCRRLGIAERTYHDLRHTHGTLLIAAGVDPRTVQQRLGHANVAITLALYVHPDAASHARAARVIGDLLAAPGDKIVTKPEAVTENPEE